MSSNATYSLCEQISKYCATYLKYDPKVAPKQTDTDYDTKILFYRAYKEFKSLRILSQGLNGFNPSLIQRVQEMQLPVNIPTSWTDKSYTASQFWPTEFLHGQSQDWPSNWNDQAPNPLALATNDSFVNFNPFRAGMMSMKNIELVDVFGRYIKLKAPNPKYVSEQMQDSLAPDEIYLPPRLVQPTRVAFDWRAAQTTTSPESFVETGSAQPAVSPICGWLWPNHLDNSLVLYDANGKPMGSLGLQGTPNPADGPLVHWFPVPGKTTSVAVTNREAMTSYLSAAGANPVFTDVVLKFLFQDATKASSAVLWSSRKRRSVFKPKATSIVRPIRPLIQSGTRAARSSKRPQTNTSPINLITLMMAVCPSSRFQRVLAPRWSRDDVWRWHHLFVQRRFNFSGPNHARRGTDNYDLYYGPTRCCACNHWHPARQQHQDSRCAVQSGASGYRDYLPHRACPNARCNAKAANPWCTKP